MALPLRRTLLHWCIVIRNSLLKGRREEVQTLPRVVFFWIFTRKKTVKFYIHSFETCLNVDILITYAPNSNFLKFSLPCHSGTRKNLVRQNSKIQHPILIKFLPWAHLRGEWGGVKREIFKFIIFRVEIGVSKNAESNSGTIFALSPFEGGGQKGKMS